MRTSTSSITDDHFINGAALPSETWLTLRQSLLWNFPDATSFRKNYVSWPGTILAPKAAFAFGDTGVGPGHIDGSLIVDSVTSEIGAETHDMAFVGGCLPVPEVDSGGSIVVQKRPACLHV